jgi:RNA polymerase sigma factor for flagellar operon FliA
MGSPQLGTLCVSQLDRNPETLFLEQLETIERAVRFACRRGGVREDETDDFASYVKLKLIESDYAVIRKYERRASFAAFIGVVVQRLLLDYRIAQWGKFHASAQAKRIGEVAIAIETMLYRDGRTIEEVIPLLIRRWPHLTRRTIETIVRQLPDRAPRPRAVTLDAASDAFFTAEAEPILSVYNAELSRRVTIVVREVMRGLDESDRAVFRLRFEGGMSVADIARALRIDQKSLYRRLGRALGLLRKLLEAAGVSSADVEEILLDRNVDLDFGFAGPGGEPSARREKET